MNNLQKDLNKIKNIYRDVFEKAKDAIDKKLEHLKVSYPCSENCKKGYESLFEKFPDDSTHSKWQKDALEMLKGEISRDILNKIKQIDLRRGCFECSKCSSCCNMASSEFTYEELKQKAQNGDKFANQFTETFVPYENSEAARSIYPEYVELLEEKFDSIQFYYCPKLGEDGLCTDYENRPDICREFPNNPLAALPPKCGFHQWKDETEILAMLLHAMVEIVEFYIEKLEKLVN